MSDPQDSIYDIAVVGGGAAGNMAYLRSVLNCDKTIMFMGGAKRTKKARGTWVSEVDNMPGFHDLPNPITKSTLNTLKWIKERPQLQAFGTHTRSEVTKIERQEDGMFVLHYHDRKLGQQQALARYVILATGVMDVQPIIQDSIETIFPYGNRNDVLYCIRCDGHRVMGHSLSIIGNSNAAIYIGAILKERYSNEQVSILTNGVDVEFSKDALKLAKAYQFEIHSEEITAILGDPKNQGLEGYILGEKIIDSTRSVVALGTQVYNDLAKQLQVKLSDNGRVPVSKNYESNIRDVFVVGDLVDQAKMQIYTAWDEAVDAADEINRRIRTEKRTVALKNHVSSITACP